MTITRSNYETNLKKLREVLRWIEIENDNGINLEFVSHLSVESDMLFMFKIKLKKLKRTIKCEQKLAR